MDASGLVGDGDHERRRVRGVVKGNEWDHQAPAGRLDRRGLDLDPAQPAGSTPTCPGSPFAGAVEPTVGLFGAAPVDADEPGGVMGLPLTGG